MDNELTYKLWIVQIKDMEGGWLGFVVILMTILFTALGSWFGLALFPSGSYSQTLLAIPGLIVGAIGFFVSSALLWKIRRPK